MLCLVTQLCLTLCPPGSSVHWGSPGKNIGMGCHTLLQESSPDPGIEPGSSALQADFFTSWATREAHSSICWTKNYEKNVMSKMNKLNKDNFSPSFWIYSSLIDESKSLIRIFFWSKIISCSNYNKGVYRMCYLYLWLDSEAWFPVQILALSLTRWVTWGKSLKV